MDLSDLLQISEIRDYGDLLAGKGQVDEIHDPMAVAADCSPLEFCHLLIIEAVQPFGQIVQFIQRNIASCQSF